MSDIFISYSREDVARAEAIARALEAQGWSVWWDRTIPAGRDFDDVIEEAIDNASCVVVLWSANSISSRWVKTEAAEGANRHILMPVLIEDVRIPLAFRRIQAADFSTWDGQIETPLFRKFLRDIADILGAPPPAQIEAEAAKRKEKRERAEHEAAEARRRQAKARKQAEDEAREHRDAEARADTIEARQKPVEAAEQPATRTKERARESTPAATVDELDWTRREQPQELQWTQTREKTAPAPAAVSEGGPWWLVLLLPLFTTRIWLGDVDIKLFYLAIPIAAWVGGRYGRRGIKVVAVGLLPFWYGSPSLIGFSTLLDPSLYLVALFVCWVFADTTRWWRWLTALEITSALPIGLFTLGGFSLFFTSSNFGRIGWIGSELFIAVGVFMIGLAGKARKATLVVAAVMLIFGLLLRGLDLARRSTDLGNGLMFAGSYSYDTITEFLLIVLLLLFGRLVGDALRGTVSDRPLSSAREYGLFLLFWIISTHSLYLDGVGRGLGLFGEQWLVLALAFIAGMYWQQRGLLMLAAVVLLSVVESIFVWEMGSRKIRWALGASSDPQSLSGSYDLILRVPEFGGYVSVFLAAFIVGYLGLRVAVRLSFAPGLRAQHAHAERWQAETTDQPHTAIAPGAIVPMRAWLLLPFIPLLVGVFRFSKDVGIELEYLALPAVAWFAHRYGRTGLKVFAFGAITYWMGIYFGYSGLNLSPDIYLVCLLAGWAIVRPERWWQTLREIRISTPKHTALVALLPISVVLMLTGALQLGWKTELLFPVALLLLGWIGARARITLGLVVILGLVGTVFQYPLAALTGDPLRLTYGLQSIRDILTLSLWYLAGLALHYHFLFAAKEQPAETDQAEYRSSDNTTQRLSRAVVDRLTSTKGFVGLGVILFIAPISIRIGLPFGSYLLWGSVWLLMLSAFMAGFLWRTRGLQLTAAAVGGLCLLTFLVAPGAFDGGFEFVLNGFSIALRVPNQSFPLIAACAPLYAVLGFHLAERSPVQAMGQSPDGEQART